MHSSKTGFLTLFLVVVVGVLTLAPAIMLVVGSFSQGLGAFGDFTLEKYVRVYTDPRLYNVLLNTFIFTFGSALIATAMAFGLTLRLLALRYGWSMPKFVYGGNIH